VCKNLHLFSGDGVVLAISQFFSVFPTYRGSGNGKCTADFAAGNDKFTLYVDPTPGGAEPLTGTVKQDRDVGTVSALMLYSTGAFSVDEIRIGTTYADVTSTPEPSSISFVGVLGFLACGRLMGRRAECAGRRFR
jgi:hypothetical protein